MTNLTETVARALMLARNEPGCAVKDWQREALDNPHVEEALRQAQAAIEAAGVTDLVNALADMVLFAAADGWRSSDEPEQARAYATARALLDKYGDVG